MRDARALLALCAVIGCSYDWDGLRPLDGSTRDAVEDFEDSPKFPIDTVEEPPGPDVTVVTDVPRDVVNDTGVDVIDASAPDVMDVPPPPPDVPPDVPAVDVPVMDVQPVDMPMPVDVRPDIPPVMDVQPDIAPDVQPDVPRDTGIDVQPDIPPDVPMDIPPACTPRIVINEFTVAGSMGADDEFVELFNAGTCTVNLEGWTLKYSSAGGSAPSTRWTGALGASIAAGAYFVLAGATGTSYGAIRSASFNTGLAVGGGAIGIFPSGTTTLHDGVAYGMLTATNPLMEGAMPAPVPSSSTTAMTTSIARNPNGADTNTNSTDFRLTTTVTAGAPNR